MNYMKIILIIFKYFLFFLDTILFKDYNNIIEYIESWIFLIGKVFYLFCIIIVVIIKKMKKINETLISSCFTIKLVVEKKLLHI